MGLAQLAQKGVSQLSSADPYEGLDKLKEASVGGQAKDGVADSIARGGLVKRKSGGVDGLRKARRLPAQQSADISAPLTALYNQSTQLEERPDFTRRVPSVSQEGESHLSFKVWTWTWTRNFKMRGPASGPAEWIE